MIWPILEARAEIQKYFRSFFGSNENFKICFWDLLTFSPIWPKYKWTFKLIKFSLCCYSKLAIFGFVVVKGNKISDFFHLFTTFKQPTKNCFDWSNMNLSNLSLVCFGFILKDIFFHSLKQDPRAPKFKLIR